MVQTAMQLIMIHVQDCSLEELPWASLVWDPSVVLTWPHLPGAVLACSCDMPGYSLFLGSLLTAFICGYLKYAFM